MEITIKIGGRMVSVKVSTEVGEFWEQGKRSSRKLYREQQRYWDGRECDEYIIAAEGRLPYCDTPENVICQRETLDEIIGHLEQVRTYTPFRCRAPCRGLLRPADAMGNYVPQTPCAPAKTKHPLCVCSVSAGLLSPAERRPNP